MSEEEKEAIEEVVRLVQLVQVMDSRKRRKRTRVDGVALQICRKEAKSPNEATEINSRELSAKERTIQTLTNLEKDNPIEVEAVATEAVGVAEAGTTTETEEEDEEDTITTTTTMEAITTTITTESTITTTMEVAAAVGDRKQNKTVETGIEVDLTTNQNQIVHTITIE